MSTDSNMSDNSETSDGQLGDTCRDYLRNVCKRGKRCKYHHPAPFEAQELGKRHEYTFCHDFQNSGCRRANCKFIHCTREEEEYYKQAGQLPVRLQQAAALGIGVVPTELPLLKGEVPICKDFLKGECKRAGRCKFRHLTAAEYEYELHRNERRSRSSTVERFDTFSTDTYSQDRYDCEPAVKRRRSEFETFLDGFNGYHRPLLTTTSEYRTVEDENSMLRRKVEELRKQVSDLAATNEVLLEQNARFRSATKCNTQVQVTSTCTPAIVTVSQVVTPSGAPIVRTAVVAAPQPLNAATLTLASNELVVSQQAIQPRLMSELAAQSASIAAAAAAAASINPPASINTNPIVPVSLGLENIPGSIAGAIAGSIASFSSLPPSLTHNLAAISSLAHTSLPQNIITSTPMISYPIMSHTQLHAPHPR